MPDDLTKRQRDRKRINLSQDYEVRDWCRKFDCTKKELEDAVDAVGDYADDVARYLRRQKAK